MKEQKNTEKEILINKMESNILPSMVKNTGYKVAQ